MDDLYKYLLENSRPMTKEESKMHSEALRKLSTPTGKNIFDLKEEKEDEPNE
jgi:hypothetical protein